MASEKVHMNLDGVETLIKTRYWNIWHSLKNIYKNPSITRRLQVNKNENLSGILDLEVRTVGTNVTELQILPPIADTTIGPRPKRKNEPENNSKLSELEKMFENEPEPPSKKRKYTKKKATEDARDATTTTESLEETGAKKEESEEEEEAEAEDEDESDEEEAESESDMDKSEDEEDE